LVLLFCAKKLNDPTTCFNCEAGVPSANRRWDDPEASMTVIYWIGGIVSFILFIYLLIALLKPEVF